jgi:hypothetical protein
LQGDGLAEHLFGIIEAVLDAQGVAEVAPGAGVLGFEADGFAIGGLGFLGSFGVGEGVIISNLSIRNLEILF